MNVLVIPEDFTNDQTALKPIIEAMMAAIGKPKAKVRVCTHPRLGGVEQALKWENIQYILNRYSEIDIFSLCVDRDGKPSRRAELDHLTKKAQSFLTDKYQDRCKFIAECAWQELEVWILAGQKDLPRDWSWKEIRVEPHPKENYFDVYAKQRAKSQGVAGGRKLLAIEAAKRYDRIRQLCPEDIQELEENIRQWCDRLG